MIEITSSSNSKYKYVKSLTQKKMRKKYSEYTVEGIKSVNDALNSSKTVSSIFVSNTFYNSESFNYPSNIPIYCVTDEIFPGMCDTKNPQGILACIKIENTNNFIPDTNKSYIYCDSINDPGNLGTIIRTADAAGFGGVLLSPDCVDLYSPKVVRSSMGSFFNTDIITDISHEMIKQYSNNFQLIGGALRENTSDYRVPDYKIPTIIIVGNEANGISDEILEICKCVKIPILGKAESLNAGVAAAILMYEVVRQRY